MPVIVVVFTILNNIDLEAVLTVKLLKSELPGSIVEEEAPLKTIVEVPLVNVALLVKFPEIVIVEPLAVKVPAVIDILAAVTE